MYQVIATGSTGNAVLYHNSILIDCGVPYSLLKPHVKNIQLVLLTHSHGDHINKTSLSKLVTERPTLRIGCCSWMLPFVEGIKNVDVYEIGQVYNYGSFSICPVKLYHDVDNCGYRIFKEKTKIIHCTDTVHLQGISAKGYDLYCIESNFNEDTVWDVIAAIESKGGYAHQRGSINSHLSEQKCNDFFFANKSEHAILKRLHESKSTI